MGLKYGTVQGKNEQLATLVMTYLFKIRKNLFELKMGLSCKCLFLLIEMFDKQKIKSDIVKGTIYLKVKTPVMKLKSLRTSRLDKKYPDRSEK